MALALPAIAAIPVTLNQQIAVIVYRNCSPCHRPGEAAPFSLLNYDDVKRHAAQIAAVTKRRYMPPWLPEPGDGEFAEERRLTDAQIQLIQDWVTQGPPLGLSPAPRSLPSSAMSGSLDLPTSYHASHSLTLSRQTGRRFSGISFSRCLSLRHDG